MSREGQSLRGGDGQPGMEGFTHTEAKGYSRNRRQPQLAEVECIVHRRAGLTATVWSFSTGLTALRFLIC